MNNSWNDTSMLLGIVLVVGIFFLSVLICLLFCYRRRTSATFQRPISQDKPDESFQENENRTIKFGPTPSWTKEKRNHKKNKHVYGALQRINEANEERDSTSVRSGTHSSNSAINAVMMERTRHDEIDESERMYAETTVGIYPDNTASIQRRPSPARSDYASRRRDPREALLMERAGRVSASSNYESDLINGGPFPLYATGNLYNRTRVPPPNGMLASPNGSTSSRLANGPLKLASFHSILKQIDSDQINNELLDGEDTITHPDPPPASADSGHPGSQYSRSTSPCLFSDNFKLDVTH